MQQKAWQNLIDLNRDCLSKEMVAWDVKEEVGWTNRKRKAGNWILV